jgi:ABC-2 type transport system permease protein
MLRGLGRLTWLEVKIFLREPLGAFGSLGLPIVAYVVLGSVFGHGRAPSPALTGFLYYGIPVLGAVMIAINAVLSLVTIVAIYRESGILKRLRATPLRPATILTAHVLVKLMFTAITLVLMVIAGRRYFPADLHIPLLSFTVALIVATCAILSMGFVIASVVPTARFAQPIGTFVLYPMLGISGLFFPLAALPPAARALARVIPFTYVVSLLEGILKGDAWSAHLTDLAALAITFAICAALSARIFRWE